MGKDYIYFDHKLPCIDNSSATCSTDRFLSSIQKRNLLGEVLPPKVQMCHLALSWLEGSFKQSGIDMIASLSYVPTCCY